MSILTLTDLAIRANADIPVAAAAVYEAFRVNMFVPILPTTPYAGVGLENVRQVSPGDVQGLSVGGTITANASSTVARRFFRAVTTLGDVEQNGLVMAEAQAAGLDLMAQEVASKSRQLGEYISDQIAKGTGTDPSWNSLPFLTAPSQYSPSLPGPGGQDLTPELLDLLLDLVPGGADGIVAHPVMLRKIRSIYRSFGGATPESVAIEYPMMRNGQTLTRDVLSWNGVPVYSFSSLSTEETLNGATLTGGSLTSIYAFRLDEGQRTGLSIVYPSGFGTISDRLVGEKETKDETIRRLVAYWNLALHNDQGLARLHSLNTA